MTLSSGMALLSSYYYGRWRHDYVGWTHIVAVIHIYMKSGLSLSFYLVALISSYYACNVCICANILVHKVSFTIIFVRTWWSEHCKPKRTGHISIQPRKGCFVHWFGNQTRISSGSSSHEWLWSVLNPTCHFTLGNCARFIWEEQVWPKCITK